MQLRSALREHFAREPQERDLEGRLEWRALMKSRRRYSLQDASLQARQVRHHHRGRKCTPVMRKRFALKQKLSLIWHLRK